MTHAGMDEWKPLLLTLIVLVIAPCGAAAQRPKMMRATLEGVRSVAVQVTPLDPGAADAGLSASTIRTDAELQLRRVGIAVIALSRSPTQFLLVELSCLPDSLSGAFFACNVRVAFYQPVALLRDTRIDTVAPTWSADSVLIMGRDRIGDARSAASDMVEDFANDYLAANPKH